MGGSVTGDGVWDRFSKLIGDVGDALDSAKVCAEEGHQYRLHATKTGPLRVTCKRCPRIWKIAT